MNGAYLISRDVAAFGKMREFFKSGTYPYRDSVGHFEIETPSSQKLWFYDREPGGLFEAYELPDQEKKAGYIYGFLVECRDAETFCEIIGSLPSDFDILIFDGNGNVYKPDELLPQTIVL